MKLTQLMLKSYRSFNYDYKRKALLSERDFPACKRLWEAGAVFAAWRPWVEVPLQAPIACVVGANEAGKSHLIQAIEQVASAVPLKTEDTCRYSEENRLGTIGYPEVAARWQDLPPSLVEWLQRLAAGHKLALPPNEAVPENVPSVPMVLVTALGHNEQMRIIANVGSADTLDIVLTPEQRAALTRHLPRILRLTKGAPIPTSISLRSLFAVAVRYGRATLPKNFAEEFVGRPFHDAASVTMQQISSSDRLVGELLMRAVSLGLESLLRIARAEDALLKEYSTQVSEQLENYLGLSHWWGQDVDVRLAVDFRRDDIVLHLTDRTATWYGFGERSEGMRSFLSYVVQVLLHLQSDVSPALILSDEPDFALSAIGQRDLLRFFRRVSSPAPAQPQALAPCQIVFTTHSPELIDPNHPARVVMLRKGQYDEGTCVLDRVEHRLFEPVRTVLCGRAGIIPFIDAPNLLVEGSSDRAFVVLMSQYLASRGRPHLDLASLSIVVANGAHRFVRLVTVSMSVKGDRAYITMLADSDGPALDAVAKCKELDGELSVRRQIVFTSDMFEPGLQKETEIEDLVPFDLYYEAFLRALALSHADFPRSRLEAEVAAAPTSKVFGRWLAKHRRAHDDHYDKEGVIEELFEGFDVRPSPLTGDAAVFVERLEKLTAVLIDRVNDNLVRRRHEEVRRAMVQAVREFGRVYGQEPNKSQAMRMIDTMRELGNRVSKAGEFDAHVDRVIAEFRLRAGLRSDTLERRTDFLKSLGALPGLVQVDPSLRLT